MTNTERIEQHNEKLRECIETAENLPDASGGKEPLLTKLKVISNGTYSAASGGFDGFSHVTVDVPVPEGYIKPSGTKTITKNGTHDVTEYASVKVNIEGGDTVDTYTVRNNLSVGVYVGGTYISPDSSCSFPLKDEGMYGFLIFMVERFEPGLGEAIKNIPLYINGEQRTDLLYGDSKWSYADSEDESFMVLEHLGRPFMLMDAQLVANDVIDIGTPEPEQ